MNIILQNKGFVIKEMDNGVLHWHFFTGELSLEDYKEAYDYAISNPSKSPFLIMATHDSGFHFSADTWSFMIDKNTDFSFILANALVIKQLHLRILAKLFAIIRKSTYRSKVFATEEKALFWLETCRV